ncbi:ABC transporter ATP-binding protein [bacterium]|nr:ABC transporter ATP-binding protein [bacterium]
MNRKIPILETRNLSKHFHKKTKSDSITITAVENVTFKLHRGETLGIAGETGSGKTTLLRLLSRVIHPDKGTILFENKSILDCDMKYLKYFRSKISVVYQNALESLNPRMKVLRLIEEPLTYNKKLTSEKKRERVEVCLENISLPKGLLKRYPHQLSGGEIQKVCIARALVAMPKLILFDEPTSNMDLPSRKKFVELVLSLREIQNLDYIFVSHNLGILNALCKKLIIMENGKKIQDGDIHNILLDPKSNFTRRIKQSLKMIKNDKKG